MPRTVQDLCRKCVDISCHIVSLFYGSKLEAHKVVQRTLSVTEKKKRYTICYKLIPQTFSHIMALTNYN